MHTPVNIYVYVSMRVHMYAHVNMPIHTYIHVHTRVNIYVHVSVHLYAHVIVLCTCDCTYTHINICTHAYRRAQLHTSGLEKSVHDALTYTHVQCHFCDTRATCARRHIDIDTMDIHSVTFVTHVPLSCVTTLIWGGYD